MSVPPKVGDAAAAAEELPSRNVSVPVGPVFQPEAVVAISCLYAFVFVTGTVGNAMVALVTFSNRDMRTSTNIFLANLSIADLLVMFTCLPTAFLELHSRPEVWSMGELLCRIIPFVELLAPHASVLTIVAITFERYYAVLTPLQAKVRRLTQWQTFTLTVAIWCLSGSLTGPILGIAVYNPRTHFLDGSEAPSCYTPIESFWQKFYFMSMLTLFYTLPFAILAVLYAKIGRSLLRRRGDEVGNSCQLLRSRRQVVAMLAVVVLVFFLCLLPYKCLTVWIMVAKEEELGSLGSRKFHSILHFCRLMTYANSVANPLIYNAMSSKFRKEFRRICSRAHASGRFDVSGNDSSYRTLSTSTIAPLQRRRAPALRLHTDQDMSSRCKAVDADWDGEAAVPFLPSGDGAELLFLDDFSGKLGRRDRPDPGTNGLSGGELGGVGAATFPSRTCHRDAFLGTR